MAKYTNWCLLLFFITLLVAIKTVLLRTLGTLLIKKTDIIKVGNLNALCLIFHHHLNCFLPATYSPLAAKMQHLTPDVLHHFFFFALKEPKLVVNDGWLKPLSHALRKNKSKKILHFKKAGIVYLPEYTVEHKHAALYGAQRFKILVCFF